MGKASRKQANRRRVAQARTAEGRSPWFGRGALALVVVLGVALVVASAAGRDGGEVTVPDGTDVVEIKRAVVWAWPRRETLTAAASVAAVLIAIYFVFRVVPAPGADAAEGRRHRRPRGAGPPARRSRRRRCTALGAHPGAGLMWEGV